MVINNLFAATVIFFLFFCWILRHNCERRRVPDKRIKKVSFLFALLCTGYLIFISVIGITTELEFFTAFGTIFLLALLSSISYIIGTPIKNLKKE